MKLNLNPEERSALRQQRIKLSNLPEWTPEHLARQCQLSIERCQYLVALAQFQTLASVGPAAAQDLWDLGCRSLADLARCSPVEMYRELSLKTGTQQDPCVEDVFRCAVAQARDPGLPVEQKDWWYWKEMRGLAMG